MIDWVYVARNALWILGLSIALAALSYAGWWAAENDGAGPRVRWHVRWPARWRALWGLPVLTRPLAAGMTLFCASLAWGSTRWWETALWALLGLAFVAQFIQAWWAPHTPR
jgi:hypothetical protein